MKIRILVPNQTRHLLDFCFHAYIFQVTQEFTAEAEKKAALEKSRPKQHESAVAAEDAQSAGQRKLGGRRRSPLA